jgi:hypothetical protein
MRRAGAPQIVVAQLSRQRPPWWQVAGLQERRPALYSAIAWRKAKAVLPDRSCKWSVSDAATGMAPNDDRALWRKDARVQVYTISLSRQTGMGSPCARSPVLATRPAGGAT